MFLLLIVRRYVVYFMHGGFCGRNLAECEHGAYTQPYWSSNNLPTELNGRLLLSNDAVENPAFSSWNKLMIDYCSGDVYQGDGTDTAPSSGEELYFHGQNIVKYLVEDLREGRILNPTNPSADPITNILLAGSSAGGIA